MDVYVFWSLANCIMGILIVAVLLYRHSDFSLRVLAFALFTLTYSNFIVYLWEAEKIISVPHFFRSAQGLLYLTAPAFYFYIALVLRKRDRLYWSDIIHLIPITLFLIDYFPFFLFTADEKRAIIKTLIEQNRILSYDQGWLFLENLHVAARAVIALGYGLGQLTMIIQLRQSPGSPNGERSLFSWLFCLTLFEIIFSVSGFVVSLFYPQAVQMLTSETVTIILLVTGLLLIFKPGVLYGMRYPEIAFGKNAHPRTVAQHLSEELIAELDLKFKAFIREETYLHHDITIKEVADKLKTQPYILSAFFTRTYQMHFNGLINKYRIDYIKKGLADNKWSTLTLEAIGEKAGFNNRTTFFNAFKKFTGMTPTQFIRKVDDDKNSDLALPDTE